MAIVRPDITYPAVSPNAFSQGVAQSGPGGLLTASHARKASQPRLSELDPHPPLKISFQLIFSGVGQVMNLPAFQVFPGQTVTITARRGNAANTGNILIGEYPEQLLTESAGFEVLTPGTATTPQVENTNELWAKNTDIADGLLIIISGVAVG